MEIWLVCILVAIILYLIDFFVKYRSRPLSYAHLNGPTPYFPVIGNLFQFELQQLCVAHLNWAKKFGPIYQCILVQVSFQSSASHSKPQVIVADPDILKEIFVNDLETFQKTNLSKVIFNDIAGGLILAQNGEEWHRARRLFQPAFTPFNLQHGFQSALEKSQLLLQVRM